MKYRILIRKINSKINKISKNLKFRIEAFSFGKIVILSGAISTFISLFLNYIDSENILFKSNIFGKITFFSGILISFSLVIILFLLFSFSKKELIKKQTNILFRDYIIILFLSILIFILGINIFFTIKGLIIFSSNIFVGNGVFLLIISSTIIGIGSIILKNEYNTKTIFINDNKDLITEKDTNKNTKLPF